MSGDAQPQLNAEIKGLPIAFRNGRPDWTDPAARDRCTDAVRKEIAGMVPDVLVDMAKDGGPTDLTPFAIIALAAVAALASA